MHEQDKHGIEQQYEKPIENHFNKIVHWNKNRDQKRNWNAFPKKLP